jgi:hypothetical protein
MTSIRPNPLSQVTYLLSIVFSVVYLTLGIVLVAKFIEIPGLSYTWQLIFGVAMIFYSGVRFYRSYRFYKEAKEYES